MSQKIRDPAQELKVNPHKHIINANPKETIINVDSVKHLEIYKVSREKQTESVSKLWIFLPFC